jgi:hypothetical protein
MSSGTDSKIALVTGVPLWTLDRRGAAGFPGRTTVSVLRGVSSSLRGARPKIEEPSFRRRSSPNGPLPCKGANCCLSLKQPATASWEQPRLSRPAFQADGTPW